MGSFILRIHWGDFDCDIKDLRPEVDRRDQGGDKDDHANRSEEDEIEHDPDGIPYAHW